MKQTRVAVLRGGPSTEYGVSLETGNCVIKALKQANFYVKDIVIAPNGEWLVDGMTRTPNQSLSDIDVSFLALHGEFGEDGTVQRILERMSVPYTGSGPMPSSIAMNKSLTKARLKELNVKTPRHMRLTKEGVTDPARSAQSIGALFGPHYFVKPERGGSSVDTHLVKSEIELAQIISKVFERNTEILVEERIQGREATVGVLENFRGEDLYLLPPIEIIPPQEEGFFNENAKYSGKTQELCPGNFSRQEKDKLMSIAHKVHTTLGLRHYSRSDFMVASDGIYFLEVNTLPGLTAESLFPKAIDAVGSSYSELLSHLVTLANSTKR